MIATGRGVPEFVVLHRDRVRVAGIQDVWRIDDEWWRDLICRLYFLVRLENGLLETIYHDLSGGSWYAQRY